MNEDSHSCRYACTRPTREGEYVSAKDFDALFTRFSEVEKALVEILRLCLDHPCDPHRAVENCYSLAKNALFTSESDND